MEKEKAKNLHIEQWVQGDKKNIEELKGNPILIEFFQLNCPGCFLYGIPEAIKFYKLYSSKGLKVIGVSTAFEDFDKNNLENLKLLINENKVIGAPKLILKEKGLVEEDGVLPFKIPFPVGMDEITEINGFKIGKTFYEYGLQGTPSAVLIDKEGFIAHKVFGYHPNLEDMIKELL
ncbi:Thiol-disulfide oxidoreductase ResA [bacterium HR34]|nr:Thiol-disulfide oxidoreductase ResA [bacterium HR34]